MRGLDKSSASSQAKKKRTDGKAAATPKATPPLEEAAVAAEGRKSGGGGGAPRPDMAGAPSRRTHGEALAAEGKKSVRATLSVWLGARHSLTGSEREPLGSSPQPEWPSDYPQHPLCEAVVITGHQLLILGNRSLRSLNLSRNRIGEYGMAKLLEMIKDQAIPHPEQRQRGRGLQRLVVQKNAVPPDSPLLQDIHDRMAVRDPVRRVPLLSLQRPGLSPCALPPVPI